MKTYIQKPAEVKRNQHTIDAAGKILGKLAVEIATRLIGKDKPTYTPHVDGGDFVTVINAKEVAVSGDKKLTKVYYRHSMFPGGLRSKTMGELLNTFPDRVISQAVSNMLPKNKLRAPRMKRLKIFAGAQPSQSQPKAE